VKYASRWDSPTNIFKKQSFQNGNFYNLDADERKIDLSKKTESFSKSARKGSWMRTELQADSAFKHFEFKPNYFSNQGLSFAKKIAYDIFSFASHRHF